MPDYKPEMNEIVNQIRKTLVQPQYEGAIGLWLEHLATNEDFISNSVSTEDSKELILKALNMIAQQVFQGNDFVINSISLRKNTTYNIVHGGGFIQESNFVLIYFPDLEVGCLLLNANRTYYIRISNMDKPFNPAGISPGDSQWN